MSENNETKKKAHQNYWQCLEQGAVWPLISPIIIKAWGPDAFRFLNGQITNNLKLLTPSHSLYSAIVTPKGKLCAAIYLATPDNKTFYLNGVPTFKEILPARLEKYLIADDAILEDVSDKLFLIHAWGKAAQTLPTPLFKTQNNRLGFEGMDFFYENPPDLSRFLICEEDTAETFRIEGGIPKWGAELNENVLPPEVGFEERWISYQKGCYTGQEIIARLKSVGQVNRKLIGIEIENYPIKPPQPLLQNGKPIGQITSVTYSPRLEKGIALAYIRRQSAQENVKTYVENHEVTLVKLPFIP